MHDIAMAALTVFLIQSLSVLAPAPTPPARQSAPLGARAARPRSQERRPPIASTCPGRRKVRIAG